jgi:hypothetical protein
MPSQQQIEAFYAKLEDTVATHGRAILTVGGSHTYTIGNGCKDLPELLLIGPFNPIPAQDVLNVMSAKMIERGRGFDEGEKVDLGGKYPVCVFTASDAVKVEFTRMAGQYLRREDYAVQQVIFCDPHGRFPWDDGCEPPYDVKVYRCLNG